MRNIFEIIIKRGFSFRMQIFNSLILQADVDNVGSDFDLNSLIEGDVDDDDFVPGRDEDTEAADSRTPVVTYYAPLKVRIVLYLKA